ncbi:MAG: hypothetical protein MUP90_10065 [Gammaproteobacteria bacterium]|nr:hypothetical protein [Gammaproteobacteria bacterium]
MTHLFTEDRFTVSTCGEYTVLNVLSQMEDFSGLLESLPALHRRSPANPGWMPTKSMPCACVSKCTKCLEYLPVTSFYTNKKSSTGGRLNVLGRKISGICKECQSEIAKHTDYQSKMLYRAKAAARHAGREFNLEPEDIVIPSHCPVLGIELFVTINWEVRNTWHHPNTPSLDRVDNSKGYVKGNVQVISMRANQLKSGATLEESRAITAYMERHFAERTEATGTNYHKEVAS